jgi:hypothetical protein
MRATITVTEEQLLSAITTIEKFSEWFNQEIKCKDLRKFVKLPRSQNEFDTPFNNSGSGSNA